MKQRFFLTLFSLFGALFVHAQPVWQPTKGPEGGTVVCFARRGSTIYAGTGSGLWETQNLGDTWTRNTAVAANEYCAAIFIEGDEMVLATFAVIDEYDYESYIYHSADGGLTWVKNAFVYDIGVAFTWGPPFLHRSGGILWLHSPLDEMLKSTDNGTTWGILQPPVNNSSESITAIAASGTKVLAYSYYHVYRSFDAGITWQTFDQDTSFSVEMYMDGDLVLKTDNDSIFRSDDFGFTWTGMPKPTANVDLKRVFRTLDGRFACFNGRLLLSINGLNWMVATTGASAPVSSGIDAGSVFLAGGARGFFRTTDNNTAFEPINSGFVSSTVYAIATTPQGRLIAGARVGNFSSIDNGETWQELKPITRFGQKMSIISMTTHGEDVWGVAEDDSLYVLHSNTNEWKSVTHADATFLYETFVRGFGNELYLVEDHQIRRSMDNGQTWQLLLNNQSEGFRDMIRLGADLFYVNNNGTVFRSQNNGGSWIQVQEVWSPGAHRIHKLQNIGNRLFHFMDDSGYYSDNRGDTWQTINLTGLPTDNWNDIIFNFRRFITHQGKFWVVLPYYGVYFSKDQGKTWKAANEGLFNLNGYDLLVTDSSAYFAGVRSGVWKRQITTSLIPEISSVQQIDLQLSPNPAKDQLTITLPEGRFGPLQISDRYGRQVWSINTVSTSIQVSLNHWPAGIYQVQLYQVDGALVASKNLAIH